MTARVLNDADGRRHPNWRIAERILRAVLPGATGFDPDDLPGLTPDSWEPFDVEAPDPDEVADALLQYCAGRVSGILVAVTFSSYASGTGPYFVAADDLRHLVMTHPDEVDDLFAGTDVVIVSPTTGKVIIVHHNGLIATLSGTVVPLYLS